MTAPHRRHALWYAFILHRVSGLLLALFLPAHFVMLSTALDRAAMDRALAWTDQPLVKLAEIGLVFLLAIHFFGGLRLLAVEFLPWTERQKTMIAAGLAGAVMVAGVFALRAI